MSLDQKALLGHKVRRLRGEQGLTQADMAAALGISPSYLNLIERNQRPVTVPFLLKLGQVFDVDLQSFAEDEDAQNLTKLRGILADMVFEGHEVPDRELRALVSDAPSAARAFLTLFRAYQASQEEARALAEAVSTGDPGAALAPSIESDAATSRHRAFPVEEVRDFFMAHDNHFPELEAAAESLISSWGLAPGDATTHLPALLQRHLNLGVKVYPRDVMGGLLRRFDRHGRRILLSEMLLPTARSFQALVQVALLEMGESIDRIVKRQDFRSEESQRLARFGLANYVAGAILMSYEPFLEAARTLRYDVEVLARRFDCSLEQVCHRLTTLARPGAKGVPFFLIRVDKAGNISKRFSARGVTFTRLGGSCPRWVVYDALRQPGAVHTQLGEMPDGTAYFSIAFTTTSPAATPGQPAQQFALAVGCDISHAGQIAYADGYDLKGRGGAIPIGTNCRLCERLDCNQRAHPPLNFRLVVDDHQRGASPFGFRKAGDG